MDDHFLRCEQEVIIHFNPAEDMASVYCADPVWIRKMDKLTQSNPEQFKCTKVDHYLDGTVCSKDYTMPKKLISVRSKERHVTDEQKRAAAEQMRKINSAAKNSVSKRS